MKPPWEIAWDDHWRPRIERVAERYQVDLCASDDRQELDGPSSYAGLHLEKRIVWYSDLAKPQHVLHEIMHVVTHPPGLGISEVPEDMLLLQVERAVARTLGRAIYADVVDWQHETEAALMSPGSMLGDVPNYGRRRTWHDGFALARRLGVLDGRNRPTWALPCWTETLRRDAWMVTMMVIGQ